MATYRTIVTQPARDDVDAIAQFLEENWSPETGIRFFNAFYKNLDLIESNPGLGRESSKLPGVRRKLINPYNALYYEVIETTIYILRVLDTRSNPDDNPY